ncbi:MAG TPA: YbaB/EbfC family nucleoid-associated protein [Streptosporangiaceae bacterium]|nr:YbaB/EbfC family nucleoid-associated protein [Streptosporangiaceae bacterium]
MEPGGQLDLQQLMAAAAAMQSQLMNAQQELADAEVLGSAGGGLVTVTVNGQGEMVDVTISADAIDPADPAESAQSIADLVLAAYRAASGAVEDLQQEKMAPFAAGLGGAGGVPGMPDLSSLTGLEGGQAPAVPGEAAPDEDDLPGDSQGDRD